MTCKRATKVISDYKLWCHSWGMAMKLADALDVSVDYLLGKERFGAYDKETVERLQEIQNLDDNTRQTLFSIINTFVRDAKARTAYA